MPHLRGDADSSREHPVKCEYGVCLCCETEILSACKECGSKRPNGKYTEVLMKLSDGSRMPIAVCMDCKESVWNEDKELIMQAVRDGWEREHDKMNWSKEKRDHYWRTHGKEALKIVP